MESSQLAARGLTSLAASSSSDGAAVSPMTTVGATQAEAAPALAFTGADAELNQKLGQALLIQWRGNGKRGNGQTRSR